MNPRRPMNPRSALLHWTHERALKIRKAKTGIFNETYIIDTKSGRYILQRLHPLISNPGATQNYVAITNFLTKKKIPAQIVLKSQTQNYLVKDAGRVWRLLKAVEGHVHNTVKNEKMAREAGKTMGFIHAALGGFRGNLKRTLSMFEYEDVLTKLKKYQALFKKDKNPTVCKAAKFLLEEFPKKFLPSSMPKRLIHTDPKISNFIFDEYGRGITMIDMDTVQKLSPLYDLGDALRSICGKKEDNHQNKFNIKFYKAFLRGYKKSAGHYLLKKEWTLIPQAVSLVTLGLAARFLNDYIDDSYFGWDELRYKNRKEHNLHRVLGQIALYKDYVKKIVSN